ncbi:hypothetical protein BpHYR1_020471 [Brachionus plicatilis]|uniref:Uncharacterized protein n=1 Tax=Brachionus plicatilis TaxID=10195 RepID=A0A3M7Q283_BRAPC|nr:hypothetical protein BpHYR1_020471 [Brachionus plicatilis]
MNLFCLFIPSKFSNEKILSNNFLYKKYFAFIDLRTRATFFIWIINNGHRLRDVNNTKSKNIWTPVKVSIPVGVIKKPGLFTVDHLVVAFDKPQGCPHRHLLQFHFARLLALLFFQAMLFMSSIV